MKRRKDGFILLSVIIMAIIASLIAAVILMKVENNINITNYGLEKIALEKKAGDAFITLYTYFRSQYHEHYIFKFDELQPSATPVWFDKFRNELVNGSSLESKAWKEVFLTFKKPIYTPKKSLQKLISAVSGSKIQVALTPLNDYNNLIFVVVRAYSKRQSSYFFGFISPKYFTNWAVFALEGVNGYYSYGEIIDGPSYFGGDLGIQYKIKKTKNEGRNYIDFTGPYFNGKVRYGKLKKWDSGHPTIGDINKKVYVNEKYIGKGCVGPYEGQINGKDDGKRWLIVDNPYRIVEVYSIEYEDSSMIKVKGKIIDPDRQLIPDYFPSGASTLTQSEKNEMNDYFNKIDSIYNSQVSSMTVHISDIFKKYKNKQPLTEYSSGIYLSDFEWSDNGINYNENANDINVITDVMKANVAEENYGVSLPSTFVTPDATVQVTEIKWKEKRGFIRYVDVAQVIITPIASLKNTKPPWYSMTFFVYYKGQERKLMFPNIGAVPYKFNGVISAYRNIKIGGEGIPGGQGSQGSQQVSTLYGKYSVISETGDISLGGSIIYGGLYNSLKKHFDHPLFEDGIDLNQLIKEKRISSMLNLVAIGGSIYIRRKCNQPKNPIIMANLLTFGSGEYTGSHDEKRGHLWVEDFDSMGKEGYRQIFGSIITRKMDPTFSGGEKKWNGYKEYNVYDHRLYVNEDLPLTTPQTNDVIFFGARMM